MFQLPKQCDQKWRFRDVWAIFRRNWAVFGHISCCSWAIFASNHRLAKFLNVLYLPKGSQGKSLQGKIIADKYLNKTSAPGSMHLGELRQDRVTLGAAYLQLRFEKKVVEAEIGRFRH